MAKKLNILGIEGKVGDVTIYERSGAQVSRPATNPARKVRTEGNMRQRTRLSNNNAAWRTLRRGITYMFEKAPGQTDLHRFLSLNGKEARVYLTQQEAAAGCCVVDNFVVSEGTVPRVEVRDGGDCWVSDIQARGDARLANDYSIRFLRLTQVERDGMPFAELFVDQLTVGEDNVGNHGDGFLLVDGCVACKKMKDSLIAWIILQHGHGFKVSPQRLIGENSLLERYTGDEALRRAMESYGEESRSQKSESRSQKPESRGQQAEERLEVISRQLEGISQRLDRIAGLLERNIKENSNHIINN